MVEYLPKRYFQFYYESSTGKGILFSFFFFFGSHNEAIYCLAFKPITSNEEIIFLEGSRTNFHTVLSVGLNSQTRTGGTHELLTEVIDKLWSLVRPILDSNLVFRDLLTGYHSTFMSGFVQSFALNNILGLELNIS